jgi:FecR protein
MTNEDPDRDWVTNPAAGPDEFEAGLERALAPVRYHAGARPLRVPDDTPPAPRQKRLFALAAVLAAGIAVTWITVRALRDANSPAKPAPFEVVGSSGEVEWDPARSLECGAGGSASLRIGSIGTVELSERSKLALQHGGADGYRVFLERGTLTASIFAAPRLFAVGTPSGLAVDLGCKYRTHVLDDGSARIEVLSGRVSFEADGVHALVPSGAECRARPGRGPGLPRWSDASPALCAALVRFDTASDESERANAITALLAAGEQRDSLTVFHLLERAHDTEREPIVARLETWVSIPPTIERARLVAGDHEALASWRDVLRATW